MSEFAVGSNVWLCETQEAGLLVNFLGASKWAVQVNGSKKSKVVGERVMRTLAKTYSILGSWDNWQAAPMAWDPQMQCFTKEVTIDTDNGEGSFRILQEGDWDMCIYPDRHDANLSDGHSVRGPGSGDQDTEWTIQAHGTAAATSYRVRLFLSPQGFPAKVDWVPAQARTAPARVPAGQSGALAAARRQAYNGDPVAERSVRAEESWAMQCAELAAAKARQAGPKACFEVLLTRVAVRSGPSTAAPIVAGAKIGWVVAGRPHTVGPESWVLLDTAAMGKLMIAPGLEPECGWVLADGTHIGLGTILRRTDKSELATQAAQDAEPSVLGEKMKQDAAPPAPDTQQRQPKLQARVDAALQAEGEGPGKTLCCVCGLRATTDREKADHVRKTGHQGFWMCAEAKQCAPPEERACDQGAGGDGPPRRGGDAQQEQCVECGMAADMQAYGMETPCCEHCWNVWQRIRDMGWDPTVMCEGRSAGEYAAWAAEELNLSNLMAREWVMGKFRQKFRARGARAMAAGG